MFALVTLAAAAVSVQDFSSWQMKHGKTYFSRTEAAKRYRIFQDNAVRMESMRLNNPLATFELNKFSDLSKDEFAGMFNGFRANITEVRATGDKAELLDVTLAPAAFDWRNKSGVLAPIQDQGQCGSCWAFSATANIEARTALARKKPVFKLAEQALVDCDKQCGQYRNFNACDSGCEGGLMPNAFIYAQKTGMAAEAAYKYTATDGTCKPFQKYSGVTGWEWVAMDEKQIAAYLVANGPVSIAVDASNWSGYQGGIMTGFDVCPKQNPSAPSLDHGVVLVGYGTEKGQDFWIVRNSWGAWWGEKGYLRIARGIDYCGVALFACSAKVM